MKGITENDKCFSTVKGNLASVFNTDGKERDEISIDEARSAFDFETIKYQSCTSDGRPLPKQWHLRRSDNDAIIPTRGLGDEFRPVQHQQVFDYIVKDILPQVKELKLETVGTMHGGATGIVMAKFGEDFNIKGDMSPHESRLFFFNPNGRSSLVVGFTNVRLFCQNQLQAAISSAGRNGFRIQHTTNAELKVDHAIETIYNQVGAVKHLQYREARLAEVGANIENLNHILDRILPLNRFEPESIGWTRTKNQRDEITEQWDCGDTARSFENDSGAKLLNAFTFPIYNPIRVGRTTDRAQITYAGMVGNRATQANRILTEVERELGLSKVEFEG